MTFVPITVATTAATTAVTTAAAANQQRKRQQEEESMTQSGEEELDGWEFKILRAQTRKFKHPDFVRQVCEEEARAGWELLEKFDDYRMRFKRRVEHRAEDRHRTTDPYRTQVGISGPMMELTIAGAVIAGMGLLALAAFLVHLVIH